MKTHAETNYNRIATAIEFIRNNFKQQPSLEQIAKEVHLSSFHFQKLFLDWAGVSPKNFLQYISINYAKKLLKDKQTNLFDTAYRTGLSGTGRLHDLFIKIEGMTPGEYKNGGKNLTINYNFFKSPFGNIIVASTQKGICYMAFFDNKQNAITKLKKYFPNSHFKQDTDPFQKNALSIFNHDWSKINQIKLHLKGTDFQLKVWEALLKIPAGKLSTYGNIAKTIKKPDASRTVGTAIGKNPIAFLIPCHRVIQSTGKIGGYMWGSARKTAIIGWEAAKINKTA